MSLFILAAILIVLGVLTIFGIGPIAWLMSKWFDD